MKLYIYLIVLLSASSLQLVTSLKEFSLAGYSDIAVYANNSTIDINLVGEGFDNETIGGGALECHTDDITCCRGVDDPNGIGKGEWYYPNGTVVPPPNNGTDIYRTRGHMVIRLNRGGDGVLYPTGIYKCVIPGAGGVNITRHITLEQDERCNNLTSGSIVYTPPLSFSSSNEPGQHYVGTIAIYDCPTGYEPVGGSVRACIGGGVWNGTEPTCEPTKIKKVKLKVGIVVGVPVALGVAILIIVIIALITQKIMQWRKRSVPLRGRESFAMGSMGETLLRDPFETTATVNSRRTVTAYPERRTIDENSVTLSEVVDARRQHPQN